MKLTRAEKARQNPGKRNEKMEDTSGEGSAASSCVETSNRGEHDSFFEQVCESLNLDKETRNKAWELLNQLPPKSQPEQVSCLSLRELQIY